MRQYRRPWDSWDVHILVGSTLVDNWLMPDGAGRFPQQGEAYVDKNGRRAYVDEVEWNAAHQCVYVRCIAAARMPPPPDPDNRGLYEEGT